MGLDMYLYAGKYVGNWDHDKPEEKMEYKNVLQAIGSKEFTCAGSPHLNVKICVAYWRKANQIHSWFVQNIQNKVDNCASYYVRPERLQELIDLCKKVLETKDSSLLEPAGGFFFGSTDIDDYYWEDLENTIKQLEKVLSEFKGFEFYYHASW